MYCTYLVERRKERLLQQFRDFLFSLSSSFATGRHMTEGLKEASAYLAEIYGEESELRQELLLMTKEIEETGRTDLTVLLDFSKRTHLEDVEDFVEVYRACRETGGDMVGAMNKAAHLIGDKISIESEIKLMVSQKKLEGNIITVMPIVVILFLQVMSPAYLEIMYFSISGRILMSFALALTLLAYIWMERITNIEV